MQEFKVGDHVIVDGGLSHGLADGWDGTIISAAGSWPFVEGWGRRTNRVTWQYVSRDNLIKVDDLVTGSFAPGDRAVVVGNTAYAAGGITHFIEVGTDVEVVSGPRIGSGGATYYEVHGIHTGADVSIGQSVAVCDLEAEPTHSRRSWWVDYSPVDYKADRTIDYTLTPAATVALDDNIVRRYLALHGATELLGTGRDIDELTAVADWLLGDAA